MTDTTAFRIAGAPISWGVCEVPGWGYQLGPDKVLTEMREVGLLATELGPDGFRDVGSGPGSSEAKYIDWLTISDREQSVVEDVARIRAHPLVPRRIPIYGYVYDVKTGRLIEIPDATAAGRAS